MFDYCHKCKTLECEYPEINNFIETVNKETNINLVLKSCPDKEAPNGKGDLFYSDLNQEIEVPIEVKRVFYSFEEKYLPKLKDREREIGQNIGLHIGTNIGREILNEVLQELRASNFELYVLLKEQYSIDVNPLNTNEKNALKFKTDLKSFFMNKNFKELDEEYIFSFNSEKKDSHINKIVLKKLTRDEKDFKERTNNEDFLLKFPVRFSDSDKGIKLNEIYESIFDIEVLEGKIRKNFINANESFQEGAINRTVLQILTIKNGYELFLNLPIHEGHSFLRIMYEHFNDKEVFAGDNFNCIDNAYLLFDKEIIKLI